MIKFAKGNLLEADVDAMVNTVNCVGVMGKGIALQFKQAYPENYRAYRQACEAGNVKPGRMFTFDFGKDHRPRYVINFPTKRHWKGNSKIADIESGLQDLATKLNDLRVQSVALPPLGCGHGGLEWSQVRSAIQGALGQLKGVKVVVFEPVGAPKPDTMPVRTRKPRMTRARAMITKVLGLYRREGYRQTLLEVQKLVYFVEAAGEKLGIKFMKHTFGPYAEELNFALQRMEGHYIRGYGDRSQRAEIFPLPEAEIAADRFISNDPIALTRLNRVAQLIDGFETPYGMELLSTLHWVVHEDLVAATSPDHAVERVYQWNDRKKRLMSPGHIEKAWKHLYNLGWFPTVKGDHGVKQIGSVS